MYKDHLFGLSVANIRFLAGGRMYQTVLSLLNLFAYLKDIVVYRGSNVDSHVQNATLIDVVPKL